MNHNGSSLRNYFVVYILMWLAWIGLHSLILINNGISIYSALTDSIISNTLLFIFCIMVTNVLRYYQPGKSSSRYLFLWCLILAGLWFFIMKFTITYLLEYDTDFMELFSATLLLRLFLAVILLGGSILLMWVWQNIQSQKEENQLHFQALKMAKDAELSSLRQQLQPHFLFNSLNSISALAGSKPEQARLMIQQLSDFLRGTLQKDESRFVSLSEELTHLKLYLDIEKVRFGYRLNTVFDIAEECNSWLLPPLLLQPIVENAIKFGLYDTLEAVTISIFARIDNDGLVIEVRNPFDESAARPNKGTGFGLNSVSRRLFLLYNRSDLLKTRAEGPVFFTTLTIPQTSR